ncbi:MAG: F0F1 ATP synthase subunit delta [Novosphingobium sp.]
MRIDWWTLGLQTINLLVLVWILSRFLFKPISQIITDRQAAAAKLLDDAQAARDSAKAEAEKSVAAQAEVMANRDALLKAAIAEANTQKQAILEAAKNAAEKVVRDAAAAAAEARSQEARRNGDRSSRLAIDIAERLLDRLPESARVHGFVAGLAEAIGTLPEGVRAGLGADGKPICLRVARPLSDTENKACNDAIERSLGRSVKLDVQVDPSLIAGLELEAPEVVVRNSFRDDLDKIATELTRADAG